MSQRRRFALVGVLALAAVLAGCGSDTGQTESTRQAAQEAKGMLGRLLGRGGTAAPPADAETIAREGLDANAGPLLLVTVESSKFTSVAGLQGENGAMRSWHTPGGQAVITRGGILAGTRGFGNDILSSETAALAALIRARQAGSAELTLRYLDGLGRERPLPLTCTTTIGATQSYEFAGKTVSGTQMVAQCSGYGFAFDDSFLVAGNGEILASRQWVGAGVGHITLQSLRN